MTRCLPPLLLFSALCGCGGGAYKELVDAGVADYLGQAVISNTESEGGIDTYTFDPKSGPMCLRGTEFNVSVREKKKSEDLFFFLQGGGACWSDFCLAVEVATPGIPTGLEALDDTLSYNPFRNQSLVYVPYCDGSLFAGDVEIDDNSDGETDRYHFGLANLSAALDVAIDRFPEPERIVLAGSSGGGYGTILASVLIRISYPDVPIYVISDSGTGVARGETEPEFVTDLVAEWNAERFLPESCPDCLADGHLTPFVAWELEQDPDLKVAVFSSYHDSVISQIFLAIEPEVFEEDLRKQTQAVTDAFPGRYAPFLIEGEAHTTLLGDVSGFLGDDFALADAINDMVDLGSMQTSVVDDVDFATWVDRMLSDSPKWKPARQ